MEPELAAQLGLQPVDGSPGSGAVPPDSQPAAPLLEDQRLSREEEPLAPAPPGPAPDSRIQALEAEVSRLTREATPDPGAQAQQFLTQRTQQINQEAQLAYQQVMAGEVASGQISPEYAQVIVQSMQTAALARAQTEAAQMALLPAARQEVATRIATEFSLPNVKIEAKDLLTESGVEGMRARAKALQELRRDQSFAKRVQQGTDGAESGGGQTSIDPRLLDRLSPGSIIKLGIMRGHTG
jgi:hypothetical protein